MKANDVFIDFHLAGNEPIRTRVHNNAGCNCFIKESVQININQGNLSQSLTVLVNDQSLLRSQEIGRVTLSTAELVAIEQQTGARHHGFTYSEEHFVHLDLRPRGKIWLAIAPVEDRDDFEGAPLLEDDTLVTC